MFLSMKKHYQAVGSLVSPENVRDTFGLQPQRGGMCVARRIPQRSRFPQRGGIYKDVATKYHEKSALRTDL